MKAGLTQNAALEALGRAIDDASAVLIGAGAGLSTAAGFTYSGDRFLRYFPDFIARYGFSDMYTGGFYPFPTEEEFWAYWSRYIFINRFMDPPLPVYKTLVDLVADKDYFVLTTNVDHCFQKAGVDHDRLFYTQGDYGLWQCSVPCHQQTYDNAEVVEAMVRAQGFQIDRAGALMPPATTESLRRAVPSELVPHCPRCGAPMTMNLRSDERFVEDDGWHRAAARYQAFCDAHKSGAILLWEIGVGYNTPGIIKYPFWRMTHADPRTLYAIVNRENTRVPSEIASRTIALQADIASVLDALLA